MIWISHSAISGANISRPSAFARICSIRIVKRASLRASRLCLGPSIRLAHPQLEPFILTAPSLRNPHSYTEKRLWVEKHLGYEVVHRLIITAHKGLNRGHFLIDDHDSGKGQEYFEGELIKFGSDRFPDWPSVRRYFESIL